jgi:DNA-binding response OmpR family regulator
MRDHLSALDEDVDTPMPKTLLLVEDSFTIQNVVQTTFVPADFQVVVAHNAREGLAKLQAQIPDVVLADATMPDMDGFQLCQRIRETAGCAHLPVLLLTSSFAVYDDAQAQRMGVTGYVAKPFEPHVLLAMVQRFMTGPSAPVVLSSDAAFAETDDSTAAAPAANDLMHQVLGRCVLQTVQEALHTHLKAMLETLTPHILDEVRQTLNAKVPELLEILLQREIEKLKREVAEEAKAGPPTEVAEEAAEA